MPPEGDENAAKIVAVHPVPIGDAADDWSQASVVGVSDIRKQMMLNLVVQPAGEPGCKARPCGEVGSRPKLVGRPIISRANSTKFHSGREMGNLKDDRQKPAEDKMKENERRDRPHERQDEKGRDDKEQEIHALADEKFGALTSAELHWVPLVKPPTREAAEILPEQPFDSVQAVVDERLQLLPMEARFPLTDG